MSATAVAECSEVLVAGQVPRYELSEWRGAYGVVAGVTGRERDFRLGAPGNGSRSPRGAWRALKQQLGPGFGGLVVGRQVHGTAVGTHTSPVSGLRVIPGLDGHVTRQGGLLLSVTLADCIPVYLVHRESQTIGLLHAGWRGVAGGVLEAGVRQVCALAGAPASEVIMHCGVGICMSCYEVGPDLASQLTGLASSGPCRLGLRTLLAQQAQDLGVGRVTVSRWCTAHDHDRFHSHRHSGGAAARMIAYLGRPAA